MPLYPVHILYNLRLPMRDGIELSANLFMPTPREPDEKFPAILEMIPYRKDDWRYNADHARMTYFAQRGYVGWMCVAHHIFTWVEALSASAGKYSIIPTS